MFTRRHKGFTIEPAIMFVVIIAAAVPALTNGPLGVNQAGVNVSSGTSDPCRCENRAAPQPLQGSLHETDYAFTHTSDVDQGHPSRFSYILKNDHSTKLLPARWVKAGIEFDRIAVNSCGRNDFDFPLGFMIDSDAPVEYGPQAQYKKPASVYVIQSPTTKKGPNAPKLSARIYAKLENGETVDFRFSSFIQDGVFHYETQNFGSHDYPFTIPSLTLAWSGTKPTIPWSTWTRERSDVFVTFWDRPPKVSEFLISGKEVDSYREDVAEVRILAKQNLQHTIAVGRVGLYLPVPATKRTSSLQ